ncbi:hypothetical protein NEMIN01_1371 [Nematocida minor]|uniref:uncharacterized protein n=1 Tax=Nematocida minor TaxID=1912983 RepID=UPI00221F60BE|nr:uncharacterized protein NEMIN01_1371 [Nematocida minor]KAI5191102.1 hypothetical protein NEMIN01_1371 [Nematocida minor]
MNNEVELNIKINLDKMVQQFIETRKNNSDENLTDSNILESIFDNSIIVEGNTSNKESAQYALNIFKKLIYLNPLIYTNCEYDSNKLIEELRNTSLDNEEEELRSISLDNEEEELRNTSLDTEEEVKLYISKIVNEGIQNMSATAPRYKINEDNYIDEVEEHSESTISSFFKPDSTHEHTITLKGSTDNPNLDQMLKNYSDYLDGLTDYILYKKLFNTTEKLQAIKENYSGNLYTLKQLYIRRRDNACLMEHGLKLCRDMERGIKDNFIEEEVKLIASIGTYNNEITAERDAFYKILGTLWYMTNNNISIADINTDGSDVLEIDDSLEGFIKYQKNENLIIDGKMNDLDREIKKAGDVVLKEAQDYIKCNKSSFSKTEEYETAKKQLKNTKQKAENNFNRLSIKRRNEKGQKLNNDQNSLSRIYLVLHSYQREYIIEKIEEHAKLHNIKTKVKKTYTRKTFVLYTILGLSFLMFVGWIVLITSDLVNCILFTINNLTV